MKIIDEVRLPPDAGEKEIKAAIVQHFTGSPDLFRTAKQPLEWVVLRKSIDARHRRPVVCWRLGILEKNEERLLPVGVGQLAAGRWRECPQVSATAPLGSGGRPLVVGTGPAGIFAALLLAEAGLKPRVIEQGEAVADRMRSVENYWKLGERALNPHSNVQFGEGGAGTFSDGKLNTGTKSRYHRLILESFVRAGAPEKILYEAKPHLGTDVLQKVMPRLRQRILDLGGEVHFNTELVDLKVDRAGLQAVQVRSLPENQLWTMEVRKLILAPGHSARSLIARLYDRGVAVEGKDFAVGVRVEHDQMIVNRSLYGSEACQLYPQLPPASYRLVFHCAETGRSAYSFCMCPGGQVVASASGPQQVVTNGMSFSERSGSRANSALLVNVGTSDVAAYARFPGDPLAGFYFQADLEAKAFQAAGSSGAAPAQTAADFLTGRVSSLVLSTTYRPGTRSVALHALLPDFVGQTLQAALPYFAKRFSDLGTAGAVLIGPESRSSSPVRLLRDRETRESNIAGLYPAGEGAGYAGGIMSAATDGLRSALSLCHSLGLDPDFEK